MLNFDPKNFLPANPAQKTKALTETILDWLRDVRAQSEIAASATYSLSPAVTKTFASPNKPFLSFDEFGNIVQWYRDVHFAPDHVENFEADVGKRYNVWTREATSRYHRHVFPDAMTEDMTLAFHVPDLSNSAWFPLSVRLYDSQGLIFDHLQQLVIERRVGERYVVSSWKKVPELSDYLRSQVL